MTSSAEPGIGVFRYRTCHVLRLGPSSVYNLYLGGGWLGQILCCSDSPESDTKHWIIQTPYCPDYTASSKEEAMDKVIDLLKLPVPLDPKREQEVWEGYSKDFPRVLRRP